MYNYYNDDDTCGSREYTCKLHCSS
jgi:hypothetical protein